MPFPSLKCARPIAAFLWAFLNLFAIFAASACGDSPLQTFINDYPVALCRRYFECCTAVDAARFVGTQAECVRKASEKLKTSERAIAYNLLQYNAAAGTACLTNLKSSCDAIFNPKNGTLVICTDLFGGPRKLGQACDDDFICESGDCEGQRCVIRPAPPPPCEASEYRDPATANCLPSQEAGTSCSLPNQCASGLACIDGQCGPQHAEGEACTSALQCKGNAACTSALEGAVCRQPYCLGN